jgi:hypothetical protein
MPVKPVPKKASKADMGKAEGGQDSYAGWDAGRWDREGFGLGQFRTPPSEDFPEEADKVQQGSKRKVK